MRWGVVSIGLDMGRVGVGRAGHREGGHDEEICCE